MADRVFTYVDGEAHFIRLQKAWQKLHGPDADLSHLRYADDPDGSLILHVAHAKVFWTRRWSPGQRTTYFTAASGDAPTMHAIRKAIREFGLDHHVLQEPRQLADQRRNQLDSHGVIEKAKMVDIALVVKVLSDANNDLFDLCNLYTSDVDYVPLIDAIRTQGRRVIVHGFRDGLGTDSPFETIPDGFVDLTLMLKDECSFR